MKWLPGTKTVRAASLKLPEGYDLITRMAQPHVVELAGSIRDNGGVPGNFPWVHWPSLELTAGGDRFAALVRNNGGKLRGASPDTDLTIEVRCFEGEPADIERLRRHENIHRRQDRDRWLREQVEEESREVAAKRVAVAGQPDIPAKLDPPSLALPGFEADQQTENAEGGAGEPGEPADVAGNPGNEPAPLEALPPCPRCDKSEAVRWQGGFQCTACGEKWGGFHEERVVGMADSDPCATCGHRADEHEIDGCQHKRCKCKELVPPSAPPVRQQAGSPAVPQQPVAVTKADKAQARKNVAAREGTTPAAVKQAEQRDRQRKGETKPVQQAIKDSGSPVAGLTTDQHLQLAAYMDGFARGADHRRPGKRHVVDPATHVQWKRGYDAGLAAARAAEERWKAEQREAG